MAGTETTKDDTADTPATPTSSDSDAGGAPVERDVDAGIITLTKSDLTQRVNVARHWGPTRSAVDLVRQACAEWLEEYEPEKPRPPDLCDECGGDERHEPDCLLMKRTRRR